MKKIRVWMAVLVLLAVMLAALPALAETSFGVVDHTETLNLRQQATQYSGKLGMYNAGDWLTIKGQSGNWYYVTGPDGRTGYVSRNYVTVQTPSYRVMGFVDNPKATSFLNLRAAPSYGATVVDYYYNGVPCVLLSQSGGWYHVRVDGVDGYFREEYIRSVNSPHSEEVATIVTPNNSGLNLRTGPGTGYASLGLYNGGGYVTVLQRGNGWWKVAIDGKVGFMKTDFLQDGVAKPNGKQTTTTTLPAGVGNAVVSNPKSTQVLNLRAQPNTTSLVMGQYRNGARLTVLDYGTEWCKVQDTAGTTGYMMTRYLTVKNLTDSAVMQVNHPEKTFVNLRTSASLITGAVQVRIPHGAAVTVLAPSFNGWVKVSYNGYTGYAVDYFLK